MKPISRQLAEWCASVEADDVPAAVYDLIPLRLLDTAGLIVAGSTSEAVAAARAVAEGLGGVAQSTVIGSAQRLPSSSAALVHGIAAHCSDFDDTFPDSVVHPGSVVVPTAVAVAEYLAATNIDFRVAIVLGYEVAARIGAVAGKLFHARNMHATGFVGPLVAAAVAARLWRLTPEQTSWAIGLATSMSGGTRAYAKDGGWSKWLHVGWAAHGGIMAADLAARGFRGPEHVLDGGSDLYSVMLHGDVVDRSALLAGLGRTWHGALAEFKYYPCAHVIHPFIDAVLDIVIREDLRAADIERIECTIAPWAAAIVCEPVDAKLRVDTELEAIGSLPYQLSVVVHERRVGMDSLHEATRRRADIGAFARHISCRKDEALGRGFGGSITVRTKSARSFVRQATLAGNDPQKVKDKFVGLVEPIVGSALSRNMVGRMHESNGDWQSMVALFRAVQTTAAPLKAPAQQRPPAAAPQNS